MRQDRPTGSSLCILGGAVLTGLAALAATGVAAQGYPNRPIRIIVPLAPGGGTDLVTRVVAKQLTQQMGSSIIVDNRPGAGTVIGTELLLKAAPDGYTLGALPPEVTINPSLRQLPYDTLREFTCVAQMTSGQYFLSTHPSVPVKTVKELIALAKARPGDVTFASTGPGSANHLSGMLFQQMTGTKMIHVPYKGGGPATIALISGETDFMFSNTASAIRHVKAGRMRAIATTGPKRSPVAPEVPTISESGLPGFVVTGFYLLLARAATPKEHLAKLNAEVAKAMRSPEVLAHLSQFGAEAVGGSSEDCNKFVRAEIAKWAPVVKASGARVN
jgi:tripartite-type tricarboxylate transporter receptor subunit TctC